MNEKVISFLKKKDQIIKENRDNLLIKLGLVQRVYSPDNCETNEYSKYEYSSGEKKYYKEIALEVTDEEYSEIIKRVKLIEEIEANEERELYERQNSNYVQVLKPIFQLQNDNNSTPDNQGNCKLSFTLKVIAWIVFLLGLILGFVLIEYILIIWASAFLSGIILLAIAKVLDYLALIAALLQQGYKYTKSKK